MSEPEYQYIRGLGWQPFPSCNTLEVTRFDGSRWRLEDRSPQVGDYCSWNWHKHKDLSHYVPIMISHLELPSFTPELHATLEDSKARYGIEYHMITVVKL